MKTVFNRFKNNVHQDGRYFPARKYTQVPDDFKVTSKHLEVVGSESSEKPEGEKPKSEQLQLGQKDSSS